MDELKFKVLGYLDVGKTQPIIYQDGEKVVYLDSLESPVIRIKSRKSNCEVRVDTDPSDSKMLQVYTPPEYKIEPLTATEVPITWLVVPKE